jgi:dTDP-4-dehydrorhamnose 3,5-epimerase
VKTRLCELPGLIVIEPRVFRDSRGFFLETWNRGRFAEAGINADFVQDNLSFSCRGTLRGLHFQNPNAQGKLVQALSGEIFDAVVDLRRTSSTFGRWYGVILSDSNRCQLYIPPGFAHGFAVLSETAFFQYKCTDFYSPKDEITLRWDDPEIGIKWPIESPLLSEKDAKGLPLSDLPLDKLFA